MAQKIVRSMFFSQIKRHKKQTQHNIVITALIGWKMEILLSQIVKNILNL